jgi:diacylglycerol kinase (ATP)
LGHLPVLRSFVSMPENRKVFFIINKYSGTGYQSEVEGKITTRCGELDRECTIEFTQGRGHATELAKQAVCDGFKMVFAMGGDGTVNEVAQGLVHSNVTMGIMPKGSGNGLARHLGIPVKFPGMLDLLSSTRHIAMDTILVNDHLSVNVSGIGFDGHVAGLFGKTGKRGLAGYGKLVIQEFFRFNEFSGHLVLDGRSIDRSAFIIALANSSQFGNNAKVSPLASVCDQRIDVCFIKKIPLTQALGFARKMFTGTINKSPFIEIIQAQEISIRFPGPMPFHVDGESMEPTSDFSIKIQPGSLKMLVPAHVKATL